MQASSFHFFQLFLLFIAIHIRFCGGWLFVSFPTRHFSIQRNYEPVALRRIVSQRQYAGSDYADSSKGGAAVENISKPASKAFDEKKQFTSVDAAGNSLSTAIETAISGAKSRKEAANGLIEALKTMGAKRMKLQGESDRKNMAQLVVQHVDLFSGDQASYAIWALGNIQMKLSHLDAAATAAAAMKAKEIKTNEHVESASVDASAVSSAVDGKSAAEEKEEGSHSPFMQCLSRFFVPETALGELADGHWDRVQLLRLMNGLVKMSVEWNQFPLVLRETFMRITSARFNSRFSASSASAGNSAA